MFLYNAKVKERCLVEEKVILSVTELNEHLKNLLDADPFISNIYVRGELSNYKIYPSGHHYFTIKDEQSTLKCVMFRGNAQSLRFRPESGMKVVAFGRVSVYPRDGAYQLYVGSLTPDGVGDLQIAFEQLKERLGKEGLFAREHKKPIPRYPMRIGVVTSSAGAAVHDIIRVLRKRWKIGKILLMPVRVQGVEAPPEIVGAIRYANRYKIADVLIVGRGGGSIEDLWAFNDERVARAIYDSEIPIISAVGHEPDVTIADYVADLRAATPSNGAELCAPDIAELMEYLDSTYIRSSKALERKIEFLRHRLTALSEKRALQDPKNYVADRRIRLEGYEARMVSAAMNIIQRNRTSFATSASKLDALSPLKVLGRGYAIARAGDGSVIKSSEDVHSGDEITVRLKKDEINCIVK